ncbi:hypothetical protein BKA70DRAFT_1267314 [Coprinopsis sp. MPI-PUGE-AT-0042]|nr:hypothetical protein BKA70DRAFT_1267314 [Coprinopsis sp. MPI-PUGE-AT-0042]
MDNTRPSSHIPHKHSFEVPELFHYSVTNDVLPQQFVPVLDEYLSSLAENLRLLEDGELEPDGLPSSVKEKAALLGAIGAYTRIKAPVRRIPAEILGAIFSYAVGSPPDDSFINMCRLRGVCRSWRHAALTTPGLWTRLHIDLDKWRCSGPAGEDLQTRIKRHLAPWLAILTRTLPYHLKITSIETYSPTTHPPLRLELVRYLLCATPRPSSVTLGCSAALVGALSLSGPCTSLERLTILAQTFRSEMGRLQMMFPNLQTLRIRRCIDLQAPNQLFTHSTLRTLHLAETKPQPGSFARLIQGLPSLTELRVTTSLVHYPEDNPVDVCPPYSHRALETLILSGEELLFTLCRYISFPFLRFMGVNGSGVRVSGGLLAGESIPRILATTSSRDFTLSLRGHFDQRLVERLVRSLPPNSNLHLLIDGIAAQHHISSWSLIPIDHEHIRAIYCQGACGKLSWLRKETRQRSQLAVIYVPLHAMDSETIQHRKQQLLTLGYGLQLCPDESLDALVGRLPPEASESSDRWWRFDVED